MSDLTKARLIRLAVAAALIGAWLFANGPGGVSALMVPPVDQTLITFGQLLVEPSTWADAAVTGTEILGAVLLAVVVGFAIGFLASRSPLRIRVVEPMVAWGYMVPFVLFYPLLLLWLGIGMESKIAFGFLNGVFAMALNTVKGFKAVNQNLVRTARAYGASHRQVEWSVKLPAALPVVVAGARVAIALALITVILAEMVGSRSGLGHELQTASVTLNTTLSYAYVIFILGIVALLHVAVEKISVSK